ncbi:MAG: AAA family ATPase, partial [Halobacteriales archaeon]
MRLVEAAVDRYGPLEGWYPHLDDGVTVLSGPNEAGKTLYLEALVHLLDPAAAEVMEPSPRVSGSPIGRAVVAVDGDHHELGADAALSDVTPIEPTDLTTVFVVRDDALALPQGGEYYRSVVERLGEVHTSAIAVVRSELCELGRLTPRRLDLSDQVDDAKSTHAAAVELAADIRTFVEETVVEEGWADLHARRLQASRRRRTIERDLAAQRDAEVLDEVERLEIRLERFETATASLDDLPDVTREDLEELQDLRAEIERNEALLEERSAELDTARDALSSARSTIDAAKETVTRLEHREPAVETAEAALADHREARRVADDARVLEGPARLAVPAALL